ncbi:MAG: DUF2828 domain-containing protein [Ruminococcus flavefaciens]|nr:DUF2828 domain-containing protein [Ruminococcus flavefaciens]
MLDFLKKESNLTFTENGALTHSTTGNHCLDLFFRAGAMRNADEKEISKAVIRAYNENPEKTMKIVFYARDARGGLGERRFFRTAINTLSRYAPDSVKRNVPYFAEYGRFDDLLVLIGTKCEEEAVSEIKRQLDEDVESKQRNEQVSLLAKWLPSVNASSADTKIMGKKIARLLGMSEKKYRQTLSELRKYIDILENRLRIADYTFDYSKQPSCAMFKYRKAFIRHDGERYADYLESVQKGEQKLNTSVLYPYEIVRRCDCGAEANERLSLDVTWNNLPAYGENNENAIAVIDTSGSMTWSAINSVRPIDVALSLGIYFAEHNKGRFANHFITFSNMPRLIEIKGKDIYEKVEYCQTFTEYANTDLEAVFNLILKTAIKNKLPQEELPSKIYIISDMEFDYCIDGGNNDTLFHIMQRKYNKNGYNLPDVVFWNVASRHSNMPVSMSETGVALVSGFSQSVFDMTISGELSPVAVMEKVLSSERYAKIK